MGEAGELIERARVWGPWPVGVPCEQVGCCERGTGLPLVGITSEFKTERSVMQRLQGRMRGGWRLHAGTLSPLASWPVRAPGLWR